MSGPLPRQLFMSGGQAAKGISLLRNHHFSRWTISSRLLRGTGLGVASE